MEQIVDVIAKLISLGHEVLLVSSGAVGLGCQKLGWSEKPIKITTKQAAASIGQISLASLYEKLFAKYNLVIGQVLLTRLGMQNRERYLSARLTLKELLSLKVVPVINENDVVADDEIKFSDNDYLAALVSELVEAERLFILTDTQGLFTADPSTDPSAKLIELIEEVTPEIEAAAGGNNQWGTGGMISKVEAAKLATSFGTTVHVLSSRNPHKVLEVLDGTRHGSTFLPRRTPIDARMAWLAYGVSSHGKLLIDTGAVKAIQGGKSLLPIGIKKVSGKFSRGHAVEVCFKDNGGQLRLVAKGIVKYSAEDLKRLLGHLSEEIEGILGYSYGNSAIHSDDLVVLDQAIDPETLLNV